MYGERSEGNEFLRGLVKWVTTLGYIEVDADPCISYKKENGNTVLFSVCIDYFMVAASNVQMIDELFEILQRK